MPFKNNTIRIFVLPTGATTGPRIVLNGITGVIEVYDTNGDLYATIDPDTGMTVFVAGDPDTFVRLVTDLTDGPLIEFGQSDSDVNIPGYIQQYISGAGGTRNLVMELNPGKFSGTFDSYIILQSESQDGSENGFVNVKSDDLRIDSQSLPRGLSPGQHFVDNASDIHTSDGVTDMVINDYFAIGGRTYEVVLKTQWILSAAGVWWFNFRVNGTVVDRFAEIGVTAAHTDTTYSACLWTPATTGTYDLDVFANEVSGAAQLTINGFALGPRRLYVKDIGIL